MEIAPVCANELERLKELNELKILDTVEEFDFDAITQLAASICQTPISLVSLIDTERQWFKSHFGLEARHTPREIAFCSHAILQDDIFIVEDSRLDTRFKDNPLATNNPNVIFYAGIPLITKKNNALGTLCVIDHQARSLTQNQIESLKLLARQVVALFELRQAKNNFAEEVSSKLRFLSSINHEMRTPINILNGYIELIEDDAITSGDEKTRESCQYIKTACDQLTHLVKDVVDQISIESGILKVYPKEFILNNLIHDAIKETRLIASKKNIIIQVFYERIEKVLADENKVKQIILNLLTNAINYGNPDSTIDIKIDHRKAEFINIRVTNSGKEISQQDRSRIFERYFRSSDYGNGIIPGLGLGLPIARHFARAQGGDLILESSVNSMTTFLLLLKR